MLTSRYIKSFLIITFVGFASKAQLFESTQQAVDFLASELLMRSAGGVVYVCPTGNSEDLKRGRTTDYIQDFQQPEKWHLINKAALFSPQARMNLFSTIKTVAQDEKGENFSGTYETKFASEKWLPLSHSHIATEGTLTHVVRIDTQIPAVNYYVKRNDGGMLGWTNWNYESVSVGACQKVDVVSYNKSLKKYLPVN